MGCLESSATVGLSKQHQNNIKTYSEKSLASDGYERETRAMAVRETRRMERRDSSFGEWVAGGWLWDWRLGGWVAMWMAGWVAGGWLWDW
ncbi:hypothetical protein MANES_01G117501v8 [Manihot esculenta]|uniref:Uncharacterized protein n=1 Tax=Manihot esculenta TaxID=3983 RepID=A0ACB7ICN5_MANES|nr:hypothetical protein MANES_01G117501v8 [Manihot esculenta]